MIGKCESPSYHCKYRRTVGHHIFWPGSDYKTELEQRFRNLPENILQLCECAEKTLHELTLPPVKPTVQEMIIALTVSFEE